MRDGKNIRERIATSTGRKNRRRGTRGLRFIEDLRVDGICGCHVLLDPITVGNGAVISQLRFAYNRQTRVVLEDRTKQLNNQTA
jgi:hypothetical protein